MESNGTFTKRFFPKIRRDIAGVMLRLIFMNMNKKENHRGKKNRCEK